MRWRRQQERTTITTRQAIGAPLASSIALFSIFLVVKYTDVSVGVAYQVGYRCSDHAADHAADQQDAIIVPVLQGQLISLQAASRVSMFCKEFERQGCRFGTLLLIRSNSMCFFFLISIYNMKSGTKKVKATLHGVWTGLPLH